MVRAFVLLFYCLFIAIANAQSVECTFRPVAANTYEVDHWKSDELSKLKPLTLTFSEFDHKKHTARKVGSAGAVDVLLIASKGRLSMLDAVPSGDLSVTSIKEMGDGRWVGAHSRHVALGNLSPSQYIGECTTR